MVDFDLEAMFKKQKENSEKLKVSANYHFCNTFFPKVFFHNYPTFFDAFKEPELMKKIMAFTLSLMDKDGYDLNALRGINLTVKFDEEKEAIGFVFAIPNPTIETECNFVATVFVKHKPRYFESELYEHYNKFGLCERDDKDTHYNYDFPIEDIRTFDDMWEAILKILN